MGGGKKGDPEGIRGAQKLLAAPKKKKRLFGTPGCSLPVLGIPLEAAPGKKAGINPLDANSRCPCGFGDPNPAADPLFPLSLQNPYFPPGIQSQINPRLPNPGWESSGGGFSRIPKDGKKRRGSIRREEFWQLRRRFSQPFLIHRSSSGAAFLPAGRVGTPQDRAGKRSGIPGSCFSRRFSRPAGALAGPCPAPPPLIRALIPADAAGSGVTGSPRHTAGIPGFPSSPIPGFLAHGKRIPLSPRCSAPRGSPRRRGGRSSFLPLLAPPAADSSSRSKAERIPGEKKHGAGIAPEQIPAALAAPGAAGARPRKAPNRTGGLITGRRG
ncbi:uncharacterized protein LOC125318354 isoform X3 [Corvus hawaiiensis]|uniref:uncharacterized protein LOC125318354 isoform X3 n=1 Tax=Corvus hawaiiensis TaxID=134902 RepID=UPI002019A411|nr:uncharacterized protein LOC125318354 isoform X3 [Corvus hawaiiensis]